MSKWTDLVTKVYKKNHAKNSSYKFKDALKDAAKIYKSSDKTEKVGHKTEKVGKSRARRGSRRTKASRKMRGGGMICLDGNPCHSS